MVGNCFTYKLSKYVQIFVRLVFAKSLAMLEANHLILGISSMHCREFNALKNSNHYDPVSHHNPVSYHDLVSHHDSVLQKKVPVAHPQAWYPSRFRSLTNFSESVRDHLISTCILLVVEIQPR